MGIQVHRQGSFVNIIKVEEGKQVVIPCRDIRGSVVFPGLHPGYCCIFAQGNDANSEGKLPLIFLGEGSDQLPQKFFQALIKDARRLACREFYIHYRKEDRELMTLFSDICRYQRIMPPHLTRAPFAENFAFGIGLVRQWAGALQVPEGTILRAQLGAMSSSDLTERPEEKFFAINALRLLVGSLEKNPWFPPEFTVRAHGKKDPRGWT